MRLDRENPTVNPEAFDAVVGAEFNRSKKGVGTLEAETAQFRQCVRPLHPADGGNGRVDKIDGLVTKSAAEAEANHGLPQFIAVIENCSTVANDTQTKYGTWPTATQR